VGLTHTHTQQPAPLPGVVDTRPAGSLNTATRGRHNAKKTRKKERGRRKQPQKDDRPGSESERGCGRGGAGKSVRLQPGGFAG